MFHIVFTLREEKTLIINIIRLILIINLLMFHIIFTLREGELKLLKIMT